MANSVEGEFFKLSYVLSPDKKVFMPRYWNKPRRLRKTALCEQTHTVINVTESETLGIRRSQLNGKKASIKHCKNKICEA